SKEQNKTPASAVHRRLRLRCRGFGGGRCLGNLNCGSRPGGRRVLRSLLWNMSRGTRRDSLETPAEDRRQRIKRLVVRVATRELEGSAADCSADCRIGS